MFKQNDKAILVIFMVIVLVATPIISMVNNSGIGEIFYDTNLTGREYQYQRFKGSIPDRYKYYGFMKVDTGWENSYFIEEYNDKYLREILIGSIMATSENKDTFSDIKDYSDKKLESYLDSIEEVIRLDYKIDNGVYKKEIVDINGIKYAIIQFDINDRGNYFYFGFTTSKKAERMIMVRTSDSLIENEREFLDVANKIEFNSKECEDRTDITVSINNGVFSRGEKDEEDYEIK